MWDAVDFRGMSRALCCRQMGLDRSAPQDDAERRQEDALFETVWGSVGLAIVQVMEVTTRCITRLNRRRQSRVIRRAGIKSAGRDIDTRVDASLIGHPRRDIRGSALNFTRTL